MVCGQRDTWEHCGGCPSGRCLYSVATVMISTTTTTTTLSHTHCTSGRCDAPRRSCLIPAQHRPTAIMTPCRHGIRHDIGCHARDVSTRRKGIRLWPFQDRQTVWRRLVQMASAMEKSQVSARVGGWEAMMARVPTPASVSGTVLKHPNIQVSKHPSITHR